MSPRVKALLGGAATVLVLGLVILGLWAFTSPKKPNTPPPIELTPGQQSQQAYQQGVAALSSEETSTAVSLFQKALRLDPNNTSAKTALDNATKPPVNSTPNPTPNPAPKPVPPGTPDPWLKTIAVKKLLPTALSGYKLSSVDAAGPDATISGSATKANPAASTILWEVHDKITAKNARKFIAATSQPIYSKNAVSNLPVNGVTGYFATDGTTGATIVYTRGRYVFDILLTAPKQPMDVAGVKAVALQAAAAFVQTP